MKSLFVFLTVALAAVCLRASEPAGSGEEPKEATALSAQNATNTLGPQYPAAAPGSEGALAERQSKAKALMRQAASLSRQGKIQEAGDKVEAALALNPQAQGERAIDWLWSVDAEINPVPIIPLPNLPPAEQRRRFEDAVRAVAEEHGFTWPQFFDQTGSLWSAVCARPRLRPMSQEREPTSSWVVLQAVFESTPDHRVTLELVPFSYGPSSYATLGPVFQIPLGITRERAEMGEQLRALLRQ
jgi:hypothetical protein